MSVFICVIVYNLYYCCYAKTSSSAVQKRHSKVYGTLSPPPIQYFLDLNWPHYPSEKAWEIYALRSLDSMISKNFKGYRCITGISIFICRRSIDITLTVSVSRELPSFIRFKLPLKWINVKMPPPPTAHPSFPIRVKNA